MTFAQGQSELVEDYGKENFLFSFKPMDFQSIVVHFSLSLWERAGLSRTEGRGVRAYSALSASMGSSFAALLAG